MYACTYIFIYIYTYARIGARMGQIQNLAGVLCFPNVNIGGRDGNPAENPARAEKPTENPENPRENPAEPRLHLDGEQQRTLGRTRR